MENLNPGEFLIKIRWGATVEEGDKPKEYSFVTQDELTAFTDGVEEGSGWMDFNIIYAKPIKNGFSARIKFGWTQHDTVVHHFQTNETMQAFLKGVEESCGWVKYEEVEA
jgi:hypothetical protein